MPNVAARCAITSGPQERCRASPPNHSPGAHGPPIACPDKLKTAETPNQHSALSWRRRAPVVPREHRAIRSGTLACQAPAALAARAGHPPLVANLSGFTSANVAFPATQVFVHPPETDGLISGGLLRNGRWANGKNEATRRKIVGTIARALSASPGSSFVDLGANIGTFSLPLLSAGFHGLLFEAMPANAWLLHASVCALGASASAQVFAPIALSSHSNGSACMKIMKPSNAGAVAATPDDGAGCAMGDRVPVATLDSLVDCRRSGTRVAAMKMDVEGSEVAVLQGAKAFIRHCRPAAMFVEDNTYYRQMNPGSPDLMQMLAQIGYVVKERLTHADYHLEPVERATKDRPHPQNQLDGSLSKRHGP